MLDNTRNEQKDLSKLLSNLGDYIEHDEFSTECFKSNYEIIKSFILQKNLEILLVWKMSILIDLEEPLQQIF